MPKKTKPQRIKVVVIGNFRDRNTGTLHLAGEVATYSPRRVEEINSLPGANLVEPVDE